MAIRLANKMIVSIVSAVCLLGLVIPAEVVSRDVVLYILIYSAFSILYPEQQVGSSPPPLDRPWIWSLLILLVTAAIVVLYAV